MANFRFLVLHSYIYGVVPFLSVVFRFCFYSFQALYLERQLWLKFHISVKKDLCHSFHRSPQDELQSVAELLRERTELLQR